MINTMSKPMPLYDSNKECCTECGKNYNNLMGHFAKRDEAYMLFYCDNCKDTFKIETKPMSMHDVWDLLDKSKATQERLNKR